MVAQILAVIIFLVTRPPFSPETYRTILENVWAKEREKSTRDRKDSTHV